MTAPNHALTGALLGLAIGNPFFVLPLAFLSHLAQDAIPHYDALGDEIERIGSKRLVYEQILIGGALCFLLVLCLAITQPHHWLLAAIGAFLATSLDLLWIPRWLHVRRHGADVGHLNWLLRFHGWVQWKTGPKLLWVEAVWFVAGSALLATKL